MSNKTKKLLILNLPYLIAGLICTNLGEAWRIAEGADMSEKLLGFLSALGAAFSNPMPSLHPMDLLIGVCCGAGLRLAVYLKGKNAKKYRHGMEYGSARWGTQKDIEPFEDPVFANNVILTRTERLMMGNRPKNPANARNKNVLVVGGSGSGKTRFWLKPNLLQCHSSYVVTDPKGDIVIDCGQALLKNGYSIRIFNTINFRKSMEKTRKGLEARLEKLRATDRKDDVITFEQLGVDRLFVDEAHAFKNLFLYTKMRNVAGLSTSEAQKSSDMFMKCQYMDELTGGRGIIFATGTPVSNSMTELYTMMRYLQYGTLQQKGLTHFDSWASTFGETTTAIELAPEGTGYRARTRFAKFFNLPELMNMFKEVADIKTSDQLHLPVPEAKFETVVVQPSEHQQAMVVELSERAAAVHSGVVDPSVDNMLKITSDGRKLGLDQRLMNPLLPDDPNSKLNACVRNVLRIYEEGQSDKLTQLLFCDLSTPKNDGTFNVYEDIRAKLIQSGVPEEEIAFIHDADTEAKKKDLFAKVRTGQVRVLLGSTQKMGAGTNVQDRLVAVHHLDVGWRPADMTQRNGRIIRQGNRNKEVQVYQYVTEGTFDAYLYQTLENG